MPRPLDHRGVKAQCSGVALYLAAGLSGCLRHLLDKLAVDLARALPRVLDDNLLLLGCVAALVEYLKLNDSDLLRHLLINLDLFLEFFL